MQLSVQLLTFEIVGSQRIMWGSIRHHGVFIVVHTLYSKLKIHCLIRKSCLLAENALFFYISAGLKDKHNFLASCFGSCPVSIKVNSVHLISWLLCT